MQSPWHNRSDFFFARKLAWVPWSVVRTSSDGCWVWLVMTFGDCCGVIFIFLGVNWWIMNLSYWVAVPVRRGHYNILNIYYYSMRAGCFFPKFEHSHVPASKRGCILLETLKMFPDENHVSYLGSRMLSSTDFLRLLQVASSVLHVPPCFPHV